MISLLTMGSGNVKVLKQTLESFNGICNEVVYGDLLLFDEDRVIVESYEHEFNIKITPFYFNDIFKRGFSAILNVLAENASNDYVMYMNTSEVIDEDYGITETIKNNPDCNAFYFIHRTDPHRWFRAYNRHELQWSGRIHESLEGEYRPYHKPIFMMKDLEKDLDNPLKAKIFNDVKEIVYFQQYISLIDFPEQLGATDPGWIKFAAENYDSMKQRLLGKGKRYQAFIDGDLESYMNDVMTNPEFEKERFESNIGIEYQGDKRYLL